MPSSPTPPHLAELIKDPEVCEDSRDFLIRVIVCGRSVVARARENKDVFYDVFILANVV